LETRIADGTIDVVIPRRSVRLTVQSGLRVSKRRLGRRGERSAASRGRDGLRPAPLLGWQLCALAGQVSAVHLARLGHAGTADFLSNISMMVMFGSVLWALTHPRLTRLTRNVGLAALAVTPTLMIRATDPLLFTGFDEQLHMRTLVDIIDSHRLFEGNPVLEISPHYPGLEAVTVVLCQLGMPTMVAALTVILIARLVLVAVLCDAVEQLTGSARAGALAVAVYAVSPQYVWFNSQFSYQTLSIPLALAAISLIGRARPADKPFGLLGGATVCLLGVAVTHHVTSVLTAAFLLAWALAERGPARIHVIYGALAAISSTVAWALVQRSTLEQYFGPMINDLAAELSGGVRRQAFQDSAGTSTPLIDKLLLVEYAAVLTLTALALFLLTVYWRRRRQHDLYYWSPQLLVLALSLAIPVLLASRVIPKGVEIFTRSSSFLFLPLSFVVVNYLVRLDWWQMAPWLERPPAIRDDDWVFLPGPETTESVELGGEFRPEWDRRRTVTEFVVVLVASTVFLGGYVLGSGPGWARLPGPYLPAADSRSMDAETLAAVEWAGQEIPPGSRIGADRVSSVLLAARAELWPVYEGLGGVKTPELYVAADWGLAETDLADALKIRYLYVDRRLADALPPFGYYFATGEINEGRQLTEAQLTKFDRIPAIELVYRHGPVSIYDLKGLGLAEFRNGWVGPTPVVRPVDQLAVGLAVGLLLAWVIRSRRVWPRIVGEASSLWQAFGPALTAGVVLAGVCLTSVLLLMLRVWLTPMTALSAALVVALVNPHKAASLLRLGVAGVTWRRVAGAGLLAVPLAGIIAVAVLSAASEDITQVRQILDDPAAVHIPPDTAEG